MPAADSDLYPSDPTPSPSEGVQELQFPSLVRRHITNCAVQSWWSRYRQLTPKTRLIRLPAAFIAYVRADGIVLPPEAQVGPNPRVSEDIEGYDDDDGDEIRDEDPSQPWAETHAQIQEVIGELGGSVYPKLSWSAPKDATWINATNSMECTSANDVYLLLKSSDFVTHDLEQAWNGSMDRDTEEEAQFSHHLALRKTVKNWQPSMEFRCFVKDRRLVGICQRDLNHYEFLPELQWHIQNMVEDFHEEHLMHDFPDENFVFDVYTPRPREMKRVWLVDINPWAVRTDPVLFSWQELLSIDTSEPNANEQSEVSNGVTRLNLNDSGSINVNDNDIDEDYEGWDNGADKDFPIFRIVKKDDPEAYSFNAPQYSAHKLPRDVVDAGIQGSGGIAEFARRWREFVEEAERKRQNERTDSTPTAAFAYDSDTD